jgi:glutamate transport system permease protein
MDVVFDNLDVFRSGLWLTFQLTALSFLVALAVGTVVATMRVSPAAPVRAAGLLYVETVGNTPLLVIMLLFVYGLPKAGIIYSLYTSAVIVFGAYTGAFVAEALRSGINAVPVGQAEAARAIGLGFGQVLRHVVLPQAFRTVVPPLGNLLIALTKNTSLAAAIGVLDITARAGKLSTSSAQPIPVFIAAALAYMILTVPMGIAVGMFERRVAIAR